METKFKRIQQLLIDALKKDDSDKARGILRRFFGINYKSKFKEGDIISYDARAGHYIAIFKAFESEAISVYCKVTEHNNFISEENNVKYHRLNYATDKEKNYLVKILQRNGSDKAKEYLKRFFGIELEPEFEPFDKVLVRDFLDFHWRADLFSRINPNFKEFKYECVSGKYRYCIPYNDQTKHLLGTTDSWKE